MRLSDCTAGLAVAVAARVAEGALPEADVVGRDVEVAAEHRELLERGPGVVGAELQLRKEVPAVEDGDAGADVADGNGEVHGLVGRPRVALAAAGDEPDVVREAD